MNQNLKYLHYITTFVKTQLIPAGAEYAEVLTDALDGCACLVLLLSKDSQESHWVKKEVNLAISGNKTVIPIQLEEVELNRTMRLYINDQQIVPVKDIDKDVENIDKVLARVIALTGQVNI